MMDGDYIHLTVMKSKTLDTKYKNMNQMDIITGIMIGVCLKVGQELLLIFGI